MWFACSACFSFLKVALSVLFEGARRFLFVGFCFADSIIIMDVSKIYQVFEILLTSNPGSYARAYFGSCGINDRSINSLIIITSLICRIIN